MTASRLKHISRKVVGKMNRLYTLEGSGEKQAVMVEFDSGVAVWALVLQTVDIKGI
jgi:hypothetical protein